MSLASARGLHPRTPARGLPWICEEGPGGAGVDEKCWLGVPEWFARPCLYQMCGGVGERLARVLVALECIAAKCLDVEAYRGFYFGERLFVGLPLCDDNTSQARRIGDITVRMFFNDDFYGIHLCCMRLYSSASGSF